MEQLSYSNTMPGTSIEKPQDKSTLLGIMERACGIEAARGCRLTVLAGAQPYP